MSQEVQTILIELALGGLGKQLVFPKCLEKSLEIFLVVSFGFTEDNYAVKIYYYAFTEKGFKNIIIKVTKVDGAFVIPKFITTVS